jgi:hypothetical protein
MTSNTMNGMNTKWKYQQNGYMIFLLTFQWTIGQEQICIRWMKPRTNCKVWEGGVDGVYSYQTSFGLASVQVLHRSQGTLLPSSVNPRYRIRGTNV